jgi:threonylcarbamoyladenosine tRNA methylthiotransferase MtaB
MNRHYTARDFSTVLERVTDKIPDISIGTDVIVGFPGEEETAFLNTKSLLENCPVTYMHIFPFSARPNTPASEMGKQVGNLEKQKRYAVLNELHIKKKSGYMKTQLQKILDIVVEEHINEQASVGTSSNYLKVKLVSGAHAHRSLVKARITGIEGNMLTGIPIETQ